MSTTFTQLVLGLAFRGALCWAKGVNTDPDDQEGALPGDEDPPAGTLPGDEVSPVTEEIFSSWALFIMLFLLISALWSSYFLTQRRIKAVHETVLSIFYGMVVGLIIRLSPGHYIQDAVTFNSSYFFNILLPPIILNSGYELNQVNFFNNIVSILVFAIPGTFISSVVLGVILYIWTALGKEITESSAKDVSINGTKKLSARATDIFIEVAGSIVQKDLKNKLTNVIDSHNDVDVIVSVDNEYRRAKKLFVFDMDSTLIYQEVIELIAAYAGVEEQVHEITERAMNNELDFKESLRERVKLLQGLQVDTLYDEIKQKLEVTKGVPELCKFLHKKIASSLF